MSEEKTYVEDINRTIYDVVDDDSDAFKLEQGLTEDIVRQISDQKQDPDWMRDFRLNCLKLYNKSQHPNWGPSIDGLDMNVIYTYVRPNTKMQHTWEEVPEDIKNTSSVWEFPRRSVLPLRVSERSMTLSLSIIICKKKSRSRV